MIMVLYDGEIHEPDPDNPERYRRIDFKKQTLSIEGASSELERSSTGARGDREMSVKMMLDENRKNQIQIEDSQKRIDSLVNADLDRLLNPPLSKPKSAIALKDPNLIRAISKKTRDILTKIDYESSTIATYKRQINSMNVEINKKFSIPVACIAFLLLGAPLGVMTRKGGMATSLGLSLLFFIIYWAFLIGGEEMADRMYLSGAMAMWLPNVIIGAAGIYLIWLVNKRTTIEGVDFFKKFIPKQNR